MKQRLLDALKHADADYAEIRIDDLDATSFAYRGEDFDAANTGHSIGGIVRACKNGGWGTVTFSSLDNLAERVREACACAALVGNEKTYLAEVQAPSDIVAPMDFINDYRNVPFQDKLDLIKEYNNILLHAVPGVQSSIVSYSEGIRTTWFASTRGNYFMEERPRMTLAMQAIARDGSLVQRSHKSFSTANDFNTVLNRHDIARELAQRSVDLIKAPQCPGGRFTVILDNSMAGLFTHEAFGHLSEADFLHENKDMRELMKIGKVMGNKDLSITDDGTRGRLLATHQVDDEGTPTTRQELIKDGVLVGHLHSLETAARMGEKPTGNARAIGHGVPPIVRMTNTFIEPGNIPKEELFKDIEDGIYACGGIGGQTMMEMFTFSASYGFRIRNGQVCELLRDVILTGNVFQTLHDIEGIGNDLVILENGGGCGKGGQSPLPVTDGGPHIRIQNVVVGGQA